MSRHAIEHVDLPALLPPMNMETPLVGIVGNSTKFLKFLNPIAFMVNNLSIGVFYFSFSSAKVQLCCATYLHKVNNYSKIELKMLLSDFLRSV